MGRHVSPPRRMRAQSRATRLSLHRRGCSVPAVPTPGTGRPSSRQQSACPRVAARTRSRMGFLSIVMAVRRSATRCSAISSGCTTIPARLASLNAPQSNRYRMPPGLPGGGGGSPCTPAGPGGPRRCGGRILRPPHAGTRPRASPVGLHDAAGNRPAGLVDGLQVQQLACPVEDERARGNRDGREADGIQGGLVRPEIVGGHGLRLRRGRRARTRCQAPAWWRTIAGWRCGSGPQAGPPRTKEPLVSRSLW